MSEFVVRRHDADRAGTHHDLHLNGESWAVPKGIPNLHTVKVLAIKTLYHSPEGRRFEGIIPKGQYGAGKSQVIDEGELQIIERKPNYLFFKLLGEVYRGNYHLRHWRDTHWLLWKAA